jgi:hypothetical protein
VPTPAPTPRPTLKLYAPDQGPTAPAPKSLLLRRLEKLEIPDCGCKVREVPACKVLIDPAGCPERQDTGRCDHAPWRAPCEHVWHADDPFYETGWAAEFLDGDETPLALAGLLAEWTRRLLGAAQQEYADRPPARAAVVKRQSVRVALYRLRDDAGEEIFCSGDSSEEDTDHVGILAFRGPNGAAHQAGLRHTNTRETA